MLHRCVCVTLLLLLPQTVTAADWAMFRGPDQGRSPEKNLPAEFSPEKNVTWSQPIAGNAWSSPVIVGSKVFLTTAVPQEGKPSHSLRAMALDAKSGKILWDHEVFVESPNTPKVHSKNSHASPTPTVDGDRLFVHFGHEGTACLDLDGKIIWTNRELKYPPVHGNGGSPLLINGELIFSCDGAINPFVAALDAENGQLRWKTPRSVPSVRMFAFCSALPIKVDGQTQVVLPGAGGVMAYDPENGNEIWRVKYNGYSVIPQPSFAHGLVFISTGYDAPTLMAIRPDGKGDVTESHVAWSTKKGAPHTPSPLILGNELYMVSDKGVASCLDAVSGKVHWEKRIGGNYSSCPIAADGKIYIPSEDGVVNVIKADTEYELLFANKMGERILATPSIADGALFLRTSTHLFRVENPK